jgi:uncharacterized membrane protein YdjX (TVP38/TMEM64 family)
MITEAKPGTSRLKWWLWLAAFAALVAVFKYFKVAGLFAQSKDWIAGLGPWGPVMFILLYILACVLFVPGSVLTLAAGALFGVAWGSVYTSIGATLGATAAFLVGRYAARDWVAKRIEGDAKFQAIDEAVGREGWKIVCLTRLSPVFPFSLLNYAFGLTRVSLRDYFFASWIGMMPGTVMYVYLGSLARAAGDKKSPLEWTLYGVGLLATITVTIFVTRLARQALARKISHEPARP